ncbi:CBO0543 family protein [Paenibacillus soyae]|uniref:Uncharacterized protein n=1 Tax=Paenibacillus soyae TaxID=2969249 RepID=A0A9X2MTU9_9BACL|nr:CBO0543 family protein [Paenibacillus soyae]MCR2806906.1 hypothetical protein [Paenibacillus soyae]
MSTELIILLLSVGVSAIGSIWIIQYDWKRYGALYLISAVVGNILCYIFIQLGFYEFPRVLLGHLFKIPFFEVLTIFPFYVLFGVRFSPKRWGWKIPFYWVLVHVGMTGELLAVNFTDIIRYKNYWDTWDSYTWWWIFLLAFDYVGGLIVPESKRRPIDADLHFRFGRPGWFIIHFILIVTIFLAGFYVGRLSIK